MPKKKVLLKGEGAEAVKVAVRVRPYIHDYEKARFQPPSMYDRCTTPPLIEPCYCSRAVAATLRCI